METSAPETIGFHRIGRNSLSTKSTLSAPEVVRIPHLQRFNLFKSRSGSCKKLLVRRDKDENTVEYCVDGFIIASVRFQVLRDIFSLRGDTTGKIDNMRDKALWEKLDPLAVCIGHGLFEEPWSFRAVSCSDTVLEPEKFADVFVRFGPQYMDDGQINSSKQSGIQASSYARHRTKDSAQASSYAPHRTKNIAQASSSSPHLPKNGAQAISSSPRRTLTRYGCTIAEARNLFLRSVEHMTAVQLFQNIDEEGWQVATLVGNVPQNVNCSELEQSECGDVLPEDVLDGFFRASVPTLYGILAKKVLSMRSACCCSIRNNSCPDEVPQESMLKRGSSSFAGNKESEPLGPSSREEGEGNMELAFRRRATGNGSPTANQMLPLFEKSLARSTGLPSDPQNQVLPLFERRLTRSTSLPAVPQSSGPSAPVGDDIQILIQNSHGVGDQECDSGFTNMTDDDSGGDNIPPGRKSMNSATQKSEKTSETDFEEQPLVSSDLSDDGLSKHGNAPDDEGVSCCPISLCCRAAGLKKRFRGRLLYSPCNLCERYLKELRAVGRDLISVVFILLVIAIAIVVVATDPGDESNWFKQLEQGGFVLFTIGAPMVFFIRSNVYANLDAIMPNPVRPVESMMELRSGNAELAELSDEEFYVKLQKNVLLNRKLSELFSLENACYKLSREEGTIKMPRKCAYEGVFQRVWLFGDELAVNRISGEAYLYKAQAISDNCLELVIERRPVKDSLFRTGAVVVHVRRRGSVNKYLFGRDL